MPRSVPGADRKKPIVSGHNVDVKATGKIILKGAKIQEN